MFLPQWLRQLAHRWSLPAGRRSVSLPRRTRNLPRPYLEQLEDRITPTGPALTTLYTFTGGTDGRVPNAGLIMDSMGNLYGTTTGGGANGWGTVFELAKGGGTLTTLASFNDIDGGPPGGLLMDGSGNLYGTASGINLDNGGIVYEIAKGSGTITPLATFNGTNGDDPYASLIMDASGNLYGTTVYGGASDDGTVFELAKGSSTITTLASFNGGNGANPYDSLIMDSSGNLYGTTDMGGAAGDGTVFELAKGSSTITTLASCSGSNGNGNPESGLLMDGSGNLYGTSLGGTVFELAHGSSTITTLATFNGTNGYSPDGGVIMDGSGNLYGTTVGGGGASGLGTVFELAHGSSTITTLATFNGSNGADPYAGVIMDSSGNLYGTTGYGGYGGVSDLGTVFEVQGAVSQASHLAFVQQPSNTVAGATMATVTVAIEDQFGNIETGDNSDTVQLSFGPGSPGGGALGGTRTETVSGGVATFKDLSINQAGNGYSLAASSPTNQSLTNATSNAFNIAPANLVVNTTADSGPGSLRSTIAYAETLAGPQTITFDPSMLTQLTGNVIDLMSALPDLTGNITIEGPGANVLAISGNNQSQIFQVDSGAQVNLSGLTIEDGFASLGGGIANLGGTVTLSNCTVSDNSAFSAGGGIANLGGTVTLSNCTVSDNNSLVVAPDVTGGGVYNPSGTLTVKNSIFAGNYGELGGGIENFGTAMVSNCTFSGNGAVLGGGIDTFDPLTVDNCSFSGNSALVGGGIFTFGSTLTVSNSTLAGNSANSGGGIANENGGIATLNNTIVADSTSGGDLYLDSGNGSTFSGSNDLIGDGSDLSSFTNSLQGNPLLAPLGNYGGPTETMALLPGSPAIDSGSNALAVDANGNPLTTDQRGQPRIVNATVDIGAFESQGFTLTASSGRVQTTDINTNFPNALTVTVTPNNPLEPVNGGVVTFMAPSTGASAALSASTAVISNGSASVTATANGTAGGPYTVTATASGMNNSASFHLTNASGPTSQVVSGSLATTQTSDTFTVPVIFSDPAGVASVDLYYSNNGGKTWTLYQNISANGATSGTLNFSFTGQDRNIYDFYSIAHSVSGAVQSPPTSLIEASTDVPDLNPPVTHALAASPSYSWTPFPAAEFSGFTASSYSSSTGTFTITWAGADPDQNTGTPPGSIATVAVFVSVDGGAYQQIGTAQSAGSPNANGVYSGSVTYNALADGQPHTYSFYTLGTDDLGVTQAIPSAPDVTFSNISYTAPLAVTALNVVQNETQTTPLTERSYIRYLEVNFNQSPTINAPNFLSNLGSNVELLYFGTNGAMQGSVSLSNVTATLNGTNLFLDFGANGITSALTLNGGQTAPSSPTSNTFGDGWYALGISKNATGSGNPIWVPFFRLLGSASGDTTVTGTATGADYQLVAGAVGRAYNANADLNGDGSVNLNDVKYVKTSNAHTAGAAPTSFPQFQLFAGAPTSGQATPITESQVQALIPQAIAAWQAAGLNAADVQLMKQAQVQVADLNGNILGLEQGDEIWINDTAAGYGWYVGGSVAANEVDLLTVLEHELGHIVGLADNSLTGDLMNTSLGLGVHRMPTVQDVARIAVNTNTAQTSMGTADNNGLEAESLALRDFLFTLLSDLATLDHDLFLYSYPLRYLVSDAS